MELFSYGYMVRALIVGVVVALIVPLMGMVVVNKNLSMVGDALSHVSLAGIILGFLLGLNMTVGALLTCVVAALFMEFVRRKFPGYGELSTAIVMSTGIGLASVLSGFVTRNVNFESLLFGSIIAIPDDEFYLILVVGVVVGALFLLFYRSLCHVAFDETSARLAGINIGFFNVLFMVLVAVTIAVSARTVGVLIISSLMVIPVACAMRFKLGYGKTVALAALFGIIFTLTGLVLSFYFSLKPGGTIVLLGVSTLVVLLFIKGK
ncbi:metal ABC transporter permease [Peptoniphilus equinus]|uniref:Metal ABC transporter permease n=1 Tax=Peptoniphilus equinus TaxID=3016343 RepID=A0ABY7QSC1_9FIRM|nr:metal ABC transporter permease [Peptoniphilus equinus]WBW49682.1 metal ABC transporter permease [Peptoniphilus equinus]